MPAKSKAQQRFMGIVHAIQKGDAKPGKFSKKIQEAAKKMDPQDARDFAATKTKGLPEKKACLLLIASGLDKLARAEEKYTSGLGRVLSFAPDKTKDHDEIVVRLKDGRKVVISNNTKVGIRVEPAKGKDIGYHGYAINGTNVVHKVHRNRRQPSGWLEYVKAASAALGLPSPS